MSEKIRKTKNETEIGAALFSILNDLCAECPNINELGLVMTECPVSPSFECCCIASLPLDELKWKYIAESEEDKQLDVTERYNPFILLENDTKLGVPFWCTPLIYGYVLSALQLWCKSNGIVDIWNTSFDQNSLICQIKEKKLDLLKLGRYTRALLLLNADDSTCWNIRKILIQTNTLSCTSELRFSNFVFSKHPKSSDGWAHRQWTFERWLESCKDGIDLKKGEIGVSAGVEFTSKMNDSFAETIKLSTLLEEFNADIDMKPNSEKMAKMLWHESYYYARMCELYPRNYYSWTSRMKLALNMDILDLLIVLDGMDKWIRIHVGDHAGFHYRHVLLMEMRKRCSSWSRKRCNGLEHLLLTLLHREMCFNSYLIECYPGHEALWSHRRAIFHFLFSNYLKEGREYGEGEEKGERKKEEEENIYYGVCSETDEIWISVVDLVEKLTTNTYTYGWRFSVYSEVDYVITCTNQCITAITQSQAHTKPNSMKIHDIRIVFANLTFCLGYGVWVVRILNEERCSDKGNDMNSKCKSLLDRVITVLVAVRNIVISRKENLTIAISKNEFANFIRHLRIWERLVGL